VLMSCIDQWRTACRLAGAGRSISVEVARVRGSVPATVRKLVEQDCVQIFWVEIKNGGRETCPASATDSRAREFDPVQAAPRQRTFPVWDRPAEERADDCHSGRDRARAAKGNASNRECGQDKAERVSDCSLERVSDKVAPASDLLPMCDLVRAARESGSPPAIRIPSPIVIRILPIALTI